MAVPGTLLGGDYQPGQWGRPLLRPGTANHFEQ